MTSLLRDCFGFGIRWSKFIGNLATYRYLHIYLGCFEITIERKKQYEESPRQI